MLDIIDEIVGFPCMEDLEKIAHDNEFFPTNTKDIADGYYNEVECVHHEAEEKFEGFEAEREHNPLPALGHKDLSEEQPDKGE